MAISHAGHDHPNTTAARTACRKAMAKAGTTPEAPKGAVRQLAEKAGVVPMTVTPRGPKGGVVNKLKEGKPVPAPRRLKVTGTLIRRIGDLADVPAVLATHVRRAWDLDWTVQVGHPFNDDERRIVITGPVAEIALVWNSTGRTGVFVRQSSVTFATDAETAFDAADNAKRWTERGNLVTVGKRP